MAEYDNTNRGVLFKAKEKKSEDSPGYTGKINVGGKEYKISAWVKESKNTGDKFFSISVSDPADAGGYQPKQSAPKKESGGSALNDDDIPF